MLRVQQNHFKMEDLGTYVSSNIDDALESVLRGKNTPEEREEALISFIKTYEKSANECYVDLKNRALLKNWVVIIVAAISALCGAMIACPILINVVRCILRRRQPYWLSFFIVYLYFILIFKIVIITYIIGIYQ